MAYTSKQIKDLNKMNRSSQNVNLGNIIARLESVGGSGSSLGFFGVDPIGQQNHIINSDGTLADVTEKLNELLSILENYGLLKKS